MVGGRSAGARVACRTAVEVGANSVLCLSFPLHPPGKPESSRAEELLAPVRAGLPVLVVQGERDPFGTPDEVRAVLPDPEVVSSAKGSHSFGRQPEDVVEAVREWLRRHPRLTSTTMLKGSRTCADARSAASHLRRTRLECDD